MPVPDEAAVRAALQGEVRCRVLQACIHRARSAKQISEEACVPPVTCYRHIQALVESGLLRVERSAVTPTGKPYDLYRSTIEWAELRVDGERVRALWGERVAMQDRLFDLWNRLEDRK